jgi:hypothetical protein
MPMRGFAWLTTVRSFSLSRTKREQNKKRNETEKEVEKKIREKMKRKKNNNKRTGQEKKNNNKRTGQESGKPKEKRKKKSNREIRKYEADQVKHFGILLIKSRCRSSIQRMSCIESRIRIKIIFISSNQIFV